MCIYTYIYIYTYMCLSLCLFIFLSFAFQSCMQASLARTSNNYLTLPSVNTTWFSSTDEDQRCAPLLEWWTVFCCLSSRMHRLLLLPESNSIQARLQTNRCKQLSKLSQTRDGLAQEDPILNALASKTNGASI